MCFVPPTTISHFSHVNIDGDCLPPSGVRVTGSLRPTGPSSIPFSASPPTEAASRLQMSSATPRPYSKPSAHPNGRSTSFAEF